MISTKEQDFMKMRYLLNTLILWLCCGPVAYAVPITMQWIGGGATTRTVINFTYEDSTLDTDIANPLRGQFDGALTSFDVTLSDGTFLTLDTEAPNYLSIGRRHLGLMGVGFSGQLLNTATGERLSLGGSSEIEYPTVGPYDTLTEVASFGWRGTETYFFLESGSSTRVLGPGPASGGSPFRIVDVPEPSSFALLSLGLLGLAVQRRRRAR